MLLLSNGGFRMDRNLLTSSEAAEYLGVTRQRVDKLGASGMIPRSRLGTFWVYRPEDLDQWRSTSNRAGGRPKEEPTTTLKNRGPEYVAA